MLGADKTLSMAKFREEERPIVVQLFGKYPEKFAYAAEWVAVHLKPDGIDINMGCPARKVVGSDHGAALLKNPELAIEIVKAAKSQISIPLSVKTRLGWDDDNEILEFAPKLIDAGADALIIHGRTYKDGFKNRARWENIYKLKADCCKLKAVIGNGDIQNYEDAIEKSELNGIKLDGVAIGRATFGKPWIFSKKLVADSHELKAAISEHAKLCYEAKGDHGIIEFRKHLLAYLRGFSKAKGMRLMAVKIETLSDVTDIINLIV
jgi:nifR3 family TIM-barrel protein